MTPCPYCYDGWIEVRALSGSTAVKPCPFCRPPRQPYTGTPIDEPAALAAARTISALLSFAPNDDRAYLAIAEYLMELCRYKEQAEWIAKRAPELHTKWDTCGLQGLKQIFCARWDPPDGRVVTHTPAFPDGIPPERPQLPAAIALPPATPPDPEINAGLRTLEIAAAEKQSQLTRPAAAETPDERRRAAEFARRLEDAITYQPDREPIAPIIVKPRQSEIIRLNDDEPHTAPRPAASYTPITQADIDAELERRKKANDAPAEFA